MTQANTAVPQQKKRWTPPAPTPDTNGFPLYEYGTFPRQFVMYRWFKPLLVGVLTVIFMIVFQALLLVAATIISGDAGYIYTISSGYDDMDVYTPQGALVMLGGVGSLLPALLLAGLIVRDRPFSSYSSSRGGWNWGAFWKCVVVAFVVLVLPQAVQIALFPDPRTSGMISFTIIGFIVCVVLTPFQCLAEEYVFRGLILQTVSSWTRIPVIGIIVQAIAFAAGHPYDAMGVFIIFVDGILWGILAWQTRGLEASSAVHIVNNMSAFIFTGFGMSVISTNTDEASFVLALVVDALYFAIVLVGAKKFNWFAAKGDKVKEYNEERLLKYAAKGKPVPNPVQEMPRVVSAQPMMQGQPMQQVYPPQPVMQAPPQPYPPAQMPYPLYQAPQQAYMPPQYPPVGYQQAPIPAHQPPLQQPAPQPPIQQPPTQQIPTQPSNQNSPSDPNAN